MLNKEYLKNVNFFIGPVTKNVLDTILEYSETENTKIGVIPSRRQIDYNNGYVNNWNTSTFFHYMNGNKNIITERDHSGISQGKEYDNGILSLYEDSKYFDIIHIDPWLHYNRDFKYAIYETIDNIKFLTKINPNLLFEIGTEESIYNFDEEMLNNMLKILKNRLGELFNNIAYCVIQSGTKLERTKNVGNFSIEKLKNMVNICKEYNILSKEHNGDYLTEDEIKIRFNNGLSAINIAPEFGVYETEIVLEHMNENQKEDFFNICLQSNKWKKWVTKDFDPFSNKIELIKICGHYQFSTKEYKKLNINIDNIIKDELYKKLKKLNNIL